MSFGIGAYRRTGNAGCRTLTTVWPVTMNSDPERWSAMPSGEDMLLLPLLPQPDAGGAISDQRRRHIRPPPRSVPTAVMLCTRLPL